MDVSDLYRHDVTCSTCGDPALATAAAAAVDNTAELADFGHLVGGGDLDLDLSGFVNVFRDADLGCTAVFSGEAFTVIDVASGVLVVVTCVRDDVTGWRGGATGKAMDFVRGVSLRDVRFWSVLVRLESFVFVLLFLSSCRVAESTVCRLARSGDVEVACGIPAFALPASQRIL